ncbi:MAG: trypsin-like serine protease [Burkholderiaceae bacterium]
MVSTVTWYTDSRNRVLPGEGYDGTGVLLYDGRAVLTAAYLFSHGSTATTIQFDTTAGQQTISTSSVSVQPGYDDIQSNNDLALVWLSGSAPVAAECYSLYRDRDEIGQTLTMVGYGVPGTGQTGALDYYSGVPLRQKASNQFDADAATPTSWLGATMNWTPTANSQLIADFDNGSSAQDALGRLINRPGAGLGVIEGLISSGDSGGPAFIHGKIASIASYTTSLGSGSMYPDIDAANNCSFGEIAAWQQVSYYQQWIDQSLRAHTPNAPTTPAAV